MENQRESQMDSQIEADISQLSSIVIAGPEEQYLYEVSERREEYKAGEECKNCEEKITMSVCQEYEESKVSCKGYQPEFIINSTPDGKPDDRRILKPEPYKWPYCVQGLLAVSGAHIGSGTIIGPNLVLTAAHNVYQRYSKGVKVGQLDKNNMTFYPGRMGNINPYGGVKIRDVYYPEEYETADENDRDKYDYALLVLDRFIGNETGFFRINKLYNKERLSSMKVHIYGYPEEMGKHLYGMEGFFKFDEDTKDFEKDMILHELDSTPGQSGAALYIKDHNSYYIIGIHLGGFPKEFNIQYNRAIFLNEDRISIIDGWYMRYLKNRQSLDTALKERSDIEHDSWDKLDQYYINLNRKDLKPEHADILAHRITDTLITLNLSENQIGGRVVTLLARDKYSYLNSLNLSSNHIGDEGARRIFQTSLPRLTILTLSNNKIGGGLATALSKADFPELTCLDLSENRIGNGVAKALSKAKLPNLTRLNLSDNMIKVGGAAELSTAKFPNLTSLNLSNNKLGDNGVIALSQANFHSLIKLYLENNLITNTGATALSQANFPHIKSLRLGNNNIGLEGAIALSGLQFIRLKYIDLYPNPIDEEEVKTLPQTRFKILVSIGERSSFYKFRGLIKTN